MNDNCQKKVVLPLNCQRVDPNNNNYCLNCVTGYRPNNGFCEKITRKVIDNCKDYGLDGYCEECFDDYELIR